jgi:hypothetical protein
MEELHLVDDYLQSENNIEQLQHIWSHFPEQRGCIFQLPSEQ